jgi:hypothetical protein
MKPPKNAILLAEGRWIEFIELDGRYDSAMSIDHLLSDTGSLWASLEKFCVADCCGFDAFDFTLEAIKDASRFLDPAEQCHHIGRLKTALSEFGADVVVSKRLNNYADIRVFNALLDHLHGGFETMRLQKACQE